MGVIFYLQELVLKEYCLVLACGLRLPKRKDENFSILKTIIDGWFYDNHNERHGHGLDRKQ